VSVPSVAAVAADLVAEQDDLDSMVATLTEAAWSRPTPSPGWTVADQIGHLSYFDRAAALAVTDAGAFVAGRDELLAAAAESGATADDLTLATTRAMTPVELLAHWRQGRAVLAQAAARLTDDTRVEWYGPSMSARSFLTARLMEAWAHGQDIFDAVDAPRVSTDRLRHIAQLGVITRRWSYANRGLTAPESDVRVELTAPSGAPWEWGDTRSADRVAGLAVDFCLVVTQRRHVDDTDLVVSGAGAREWLEIAQAFAGPPTAGPGPQAVSRC
jgi:uncharacterized protein (TIGR03084 family)